MLCASSLPPCWQNAGFDQRFCPVCFSTQLARMQTPAESITACREQQRAVVRSAVCSRSSEDSLLGVYGVSSRCRGNEPTRSHFEIHEIGFSLHTPKNDFSLLYGDYPVVHPSTPTPICRFRANNENSQFHSSTVWSQKIRKYSFFKLDIKRQCDRNLD